MTFKFNLDEVVYSRPDEEYATVIQKRVEYGSQIYYRLDNDRIRHESQLHKAKKVSEPIGGQ